MTEELRSYTGRYGHYLIGGHGKPLVLLHGFLSSCEEFGGRFRELAALRTLIVPDLPGNGETPALPGRHSAAAMAEAVDSLLGELGVGEYDAAGLCLGASVVCALARDGRAPIDRMVLHTPLIAPDLVRRRYRQQVSLLAFPPFWWTVATLSRNRTVSNLYKRFIIHEGDVDRRTREVNFVNQVKADQRAAREWVMDSLRRDDVDVLVNRTRPTLVIVAAQDRLVHVDRLRGLVDGLPDVTLTVDAQQGHGWNAAAVRSQLEILRTFLGKPDPAGRPTAATSPLTGTSGA